jgi:hypothetical protein
MYGVGHTSLVVKVRLFDATRGASLSIRIDGYGCALLRRKR